MKTKLLTGFIVMALAACSGARTTGGDTGDQSVAELKKAAAEAQASGSAQGDVCGSSGWYGDGECDTFCQDDDRLDCATDPGGVVCAAFVEEANGYCSRLPTDPCISQDPDCRGQTEPGTPDDPIVCTTIAQLPDGVCVLDPSDPCVRYQDPDCTATGPTTPDEPIACPAIAQLPDGVCRLDSSDPCLVYQDPDCGGSGTSPGYPGAPSDPGDDPDKPTDPVACAEYIELSDGVCQRDPADPCIFQDPDCARE